MEFSPAAIKVLNISFRLQLSSFDCLFVVVVCVPCIPRLAFEKCKLHTRPAMTYKPASISVLPSISSALLRSLLIAVIVLTSSFLRLF